MDNKNKGYLLFINALTPIHVGSSESGAIDKPIQRDHLGLPIIFSSSLKGALRHQIDWGNKEDEIFGSESETGSKGSEPGNIIFLDARPLFIPVRSLIGTYAYVTSPMLLRKLQEYGEIMGKKLNLPLNIEIGDYEAIILKENSERKILKDSKVYLNEIELSVKNVQQNDNFKQFLSDDIIKKLKIENENIVLVSDSIIVDMVGRSTIIYWRNRLEVDRKVVKEGGLWSEEYLPDGIIFVSGFLRTRYKKEGQQNQPSQQEDLLDIVKKKLEENKIISIGGLETIGKGLVELIIE